MKSMIIRILKERKKNIDNGIHKDANLGRTVLRMSNSMYGLTGIRHITNEEFEKMKDKITAIESDETEVVVWDSNII